MNDIDELEKPVLPDEVAEVVQYLRGSTIPLNALFKNNQWWQQRVVDLQARIEELESDGAHSCGPHCQRPNCVTRRNLHEAEARIEELEDRLTLSKDQTDRTINKLDAALAALDEARDIILKNAPEAMPAFAVTLLNLGGRRRNESFE